MWKRAIQVVALLVSLSVSGPSQAQAAQQVIVDERDTVELAGSVHPLARPENDAGAMDESLPMERITLAFRLDADKQTALERLLREQQDPASPNFHRWLTSDEFGARFGRSPEEIATVVAWLHSHGFKVEKIPRGRTWINFSGTAGDVNRVFHADMRDFMVDGSLRHANSRNPTVPRAFAHIVKGIVTLNSIPAPNHLIRQSSSDILSGGAHFLSPADFAKLYNLPAGFTGAGQTIAIVARSNIDISDVRTFRSHFGLPAKDPQVLVNGPDPGDLGSNPLCWLARSMDACLADEQEADLDTEWSGAVAPGANIDLVVSASTNAAGGEYLSAQYAIEQNQAQVLSSSFGPCEQLMTPTELSNYYDLWSRAASQGITVVASSGDWGAAGCSYETNQYELNQAVSGICSTPFNVCVGGTKFDDETNPSLYWSAGGVALGPIPEVSWNESGHGATGGGKSNDNGSFVGYAKPEWQMATGVPSDGKRDVPDVSLSAALHDGYEIVQDGIFNQIGGTSASAPAFAGIMALVVQKTGQRQGNPNPVLYQLARAQAAGSIGAVFHDVLATDNTYAGVTGFSCKSGYDQATGLGSVDASQLVQNWPALGATLSANPAGGVAPFTTGLTAHAIGEGFGTINYTFWWDCPFVVSTVQEGIQKCQDPSDPAVGVKVDGLSALSEFVLHVYQNVGTYKPLVIVERNNGATAATTTVAASSSGVCTSFTLSPASASPTSAAGSQQVAVVGVPSGCQGGNWTASGNGSWLTVSPASGSGSRNVTVSWTANTSSSTRSASATIAGAGFSVTQAGVTAPPAAPYLLSPGASVFPGTTTGLSPSFFWLAVAGADSYQLELSDASTVYPVQTIAAPLTSIALSSPLVDNHAYTWRMRSHGAGGWGAYGGYYYFSTYTGQTANFSLSASPSAATVTPGASAAFILNTATVQGSPQTLTFSAGSLPAGVSPSFSLVTVQSGSQTTLTLAVGAGTAQGNYAIVVSATSNANVTHTVSLGLTVNPQITNGEPAVCLTPPSLGFSDQMVGTSSPTQLVNLRNCGNGPLHVSSIGASPEFFLGAGSIVPPVDLPAGVATTFQVGFAPLAAGPRTGSVKVFSNAAGSPAVLALSGTATPAPLTTGTVEVQAMLNGVPFSGFTVFSLTGPGGTINFGNVPLSRPDQGVGDYTVAFVGSPAGGGTLTSITPASTQTLTAGGAILFTLNFTAPNEFAFSCPTALVGNTTAIMVTPAGGGSASVPLTAAYMIGGAETIALAVSGLPAGATASFNPQPLVLPSGQPTASSTFTVTTSALTPQGLYQLTFSATNQDGTTHFLTGTLVVLASAAPQLVSIGPGAVLSNDYNDLPSMSTDGRYVAFFSNATDLVTGDTNGVGDVFIRDRQTGTTSRVSVASDGSQGDDWSGWPAISADGRFVAFHSYAGNLIPGGRRGFGDVYVRDRQLGQTVRVNLSSTGEPADSTCLFASISGDGRFVAFNSKATNLVPGGGGGSNQVYVKDRLSGKITLASAANDGTPGDADSTSPALSGDGRYVVFFSAASNFVPGATAAGRQVFLRDLREGTITLVSGPNDGSPPNGTIPNFSSERLAISLDGRYVAFTSYASNLVPGDNNFNGDVFVWDRTTKTTTIASTTNDGSLFYGSSSAPALNADGRFVAFRTGIAGTPSAEIGVRDMVTGRTVLYSVGPGNALGSAFSVDSVLSGDGRVLAFASNAPNLVAGDTNNQQDIFSVALPASGSAFAQTLTVSPGSMAGGGTATGTVTLSAPAPAGGATVTLSSSAVEAQVPSVVTVPAGSSSVSFSIPTLAVSGDLPISLIASYGGGSPWTLLTLVKPLPARVDVLQGDAQIADLGTPLPVLLSVRVLDTTNNPAANVAVQISAPAAGPSGAFPGGVTSALVTTDASGIATAPAFTANSIPGQYAVTATAAGVASPAVFTLANAGGGFYTVTPCRLIDTRQAVGNLGGPALQPGAQRTFAVAGTCGVPSTATALSLNVTVANATADGYLTLARGGQTPPVSASITFRAGVTRSNNALAGLALDGTGTYLVVNGSPGTVDLILDVNGYFQ